MPQILESWKLCHNMLCEWQMSLLPKFGGFLSKFRWSPSPSKLEEQHEVILGDFPLSWGKIHVHSFFSNSIQSSCAQPPACHMGEITHPNWAPYMKDIGSYIWATHGIASHNKQCKPHKKILRAWSMTFHIFFDPHGSGHHPTLVDTFHPHRLPPNALQTPNVKASLLSSIHLRICRPWPACQCLHQNQSVLSMLLLTTCLTEQNHGHNGCERSQCHGLPVLC
jgi:hypothetical protein